MAQSPLSPEKKLTKPAFSPLTLWLTDFLDHVDLALFMSLSPLWYILLFPDSWTLAEKTQWFHSFKFLISVLVYPLGAFVFSSIAQIKSPVTALRLSVWGFSLCTMAMGLVPTSWPFFGLYLMAACRFLQCFFSRGDRTIGPIYLMANTPNATALDRAVIYDVVLISGQWVAQIIAYALLMTNDLFLWRISFIVSGIVGCFCAYFRFKNTEKIPSTIPSKSPLNLPIKQRPSWKWFAALACMTGPSYLFYDLCFYLMTDFVPMVTHLPFSALAGQKMYLSPLDMGILFVSYVVLKRLHLTAHRLLSIMSGIGIMGIALLIPMFSTLSIYPHLLYVGFFRCVLIALGVPYALCLFILLRQAIASSSKPYLFIPLAQVIGTIFLGHSTCMISFKLYNLLPYAGTAGVYGSVVCALSLWGNRWFKRCVVTTLPPS
jgi:MFS family permease